MFDCPEQKHHQFTQQAQWTQSIRAYLTSHSQLPTHMKCLEVGCGTGAILSEWNTHSSIPVGIDINFSSLQYAKKNVTNPMATSDAQYLPFPSDTFHCIFTHYFFLWIKQPVEVLQEIVRCLNPGGFLFIFAEPDYGGRIDYPLELSNIREMQLQALEKDGADPRIGGKMQQYLHISGLENITGGILGCEWSGSNISNGIDLENILLDAEKSGIPINKEYLQKIHKKALLEKTRISYVPTFFYSAQKV